MNFPTTRKNALRKFLHVQDASSATIKAISKKYSNKALLITGKRNFKIKNLLRYLKKKMKIKKNIEFGNKTDMGHYDKSPFSYKPIRNETYILKNSKYFFLGKLLIRITGNIIDAKIQT